MRIAFSSDNHLDINKAAAADIVPQQAALLRSEHIDYYVNAGDTYNDFGATRTYFHQLQAATGPNTQIRFIAGNHDMLNGVDFATLESLSDPLYLHRRVESLPGTDAVLIGNNGWYDYSFGPSTLTATDFLHWKRAYWVDGQIEQPLSDAERMNLTLQWTERALQNAAGKRVLYVTHFVPERSFIAERMQQDKIGGKVAAMLGSQRLGELLAKHHVDYVDFGHLHRRDAPSTIHGVHYLHQPLGYGTKRRHEWVTTDFMTEWRTTISIIDL
ncbi:metallophosphoesterase [Lacticaseibacillus zhaodongensis]|uniref:metallophosphoesterase n=1 Tax=Lacticaseibacillus zhaodongensis TaxID=2668065 RepID=UPI0012D2E166|nr:metallophosphoesterase [Lacticaseibacillus zhaodongensis]